MPSISCVLQQLQLVPRKTPKAGASSAEDAECPDGETAGCACTRCANTAPISLPIKEKYPRGDGGGTPQCGVGWVARSGWVMVGRLGQEEKKTSAKR